MAAALQVGIQPHMQHLEKFPIIFGGDLISMNMPPMKKRRDFRVLGCWGHLKNLLVNLDDVHTFRLIIKYLQNFSSVI